jgi:predicted HicB family RNase H-like nuclease
MGAPENNKNRELPPELRRSVRIAFRVTPAEHAKLRVWARRRRQTLTEFIRNQLGLWTS